MRLVCPLMIFLFFMPHNPHNLIKVKLFYLIESALKRIFKDEGTLYLACNDKKAFSLLQTIVGLVRMYVTSYRISWIISNILSLG